MRTLNSDDGGVDDLRSRGSAERVPKGVCVSRSEGDGLPAPHTLYQPRQADQRTGCVQRFSESLASGPKSHIECTAATTLPAARRMKFAPTLALAVLSFVNLVSSLGDPAPTSGRASTTARVVAITETPAAPIATGRSVSVAHEAIPLDVLPSVRGGTEQ